MLIFDIGANHGRYTDDMLKINSSATIVCIEANPKLAAYLVDKYRGSDGIKVYNYAASNVAGIQLPFHINNSENGISTLSMDWITKSRFSGLRWDEVVNVDTITIDSLVSTFGIPDILKIDVEGYELEVLQGLSKKVGIVTFEWAEEQKDNILKTCAHIHSLGYAEFTYRETDTPYNYIPDTFHNYEEFLNIFGETLIPERKEKWGMVFAK